MYPSIFYQQLDPNVYAPAGPLVEGPHVYGPLPSYATFALPASLDSSGYELDFSAPTLGYFNNAWWRTAGSPSASLDDFVPFFQTAHNGYPQDGYFWLAPAMLGTYHLDALTGSCVAIARSNWSDELSRFVPGWAVFPIAFLEQTPANDVIDPFTLDSIGSGSWYHRP